MKNKKKNPWNSLTYNQKYDIGRSLGWPWSVCVKLASMHWEDFGQRTKNLIIVVTGKFKFLSLI